MKTIARFVVLATVVSLAALVVTPVTGQAFETDDGSLSPNPVYINGPNGPEVFIVGDSISAQSEQRDDYAWINGGLGWHTHIEATGGSDILMHQRWHSFDHARTSNAAAVFVELGTNDIGQINKTLPTNQALIEIAKVFTAVDQAVGALNGKCIVWVGLNEQFDNFVTWPAPRGREVYDDKDVSKAFDDHIKSLMSSHPNLHYADYGAYVANDATFRDSLLADGTNYIHPSTTAGRVELANFEAWYSELYCGV
jgi:GDSL-like lipase/acylhydrolase family protein